MRPEVTAKLDAIVAVARKARPNGVRPCPPDFATDEAREEPEAEGAVEATLALKGMRR
jgi:hypothetical protein